MLDPLFEDARQDPQSVGGSKADHLQPAGRYTANARYSRENLIPIDEDADLAAHITQIFDINDPIRKLYLLHCSHQAEITEVEACLLKEIMCLRTIVAGYLEYDGLWRDANGGALQDINFQELNARLARQLEKEVSKRLEILSNSCAVQTLAPDLHNVHVQTVCPPGVQRASSASSSADPDIHALGPYLSTDIKRPTQLHNPLTGKLKQMHELLAEKETRIATLSSELVDLRERLTASQGSPAFGRQSPDGQAGPLRWPLTGQEAKLVVKPRSASAGMYTSKPAQEPLTTVDTQRASSTKRHLSLQKEAPPITSADLVPKTVLLNLHKSISEKDALLAEKSEIILAQQKQISWLKEMLQANTVEKEKAALQSSVRVKFQAQPEVANHVEPTASSQPPQRRRSQKVEAMLDALELESQVMSLKNQMLDVSSGKTVPAEAMSRLSLLENELVQRSIYLADLETPAPPLPQAAQPDALDDEISRLIADQQSILETAERSIPRITETLQ